MENGSITKTVHGGIQRSTRKRSFFDFPAIIAVDGRIKEKGSANNQSTAFLTG